MRGKAQLALAGVAPVVALAGVGIAWDSPYQPFEVVEGTLALIVGAVVLGVGVGVWFWRRSPRLTLVAVGVAAICGGPWMVLGSWVANGAGVDSAVEDVECVLVSDYAPSVSQSRRASEMFECNASWGSLRAERLLETRSSQPRPRGTRDIVRLRRGRLGWALREN